MYWEASGFELLNCDIHELVVENRTPLLSFMYICVPAPIWRRLLKSFVALLRAPKALIEGLEWRIASRMPMIADYDKQLDEGEGALSRGRGTFRSWIWG